MNHRLVLRGIASVAFGLLLSAASQAQGIFRTYLSGSGNDSNPCTLVAPCRLLPAAIAAVVSGGEIWMLDSANYNTGPVNINKSVTILAVPGALGSVVALGGNAIDIATAGVRVALRNLVIVPFVGGLGTGGINMTAGASLAVDNCLIANLPGTGITVSTAASILVTDSTVRNNGDKGMLFLSGSRATIARATVSGNASVGIWVLGPTAGTTSADIADSTINGNGYGVVAYSDVASAIVRVSVIRSSAVGNASDGLAAQSNNPGGTATLSASNNSISNNGNGISAYYPGSRIWATGNSISNNNVGLSNTNSGLIESASDNAVNNNGTNIGGSAIVPIAKI